MSEDADFCEDGETMIARDGAVAIPGGFYITDDSQEEVEEDEVPQVLLEARPAFRHSGRGTSDKGNRAQHNDERYDRRAMRLGENPKGFITVAKPSERRPFFLGASWTFVTLDPEEVLWDTGAQEGHSNLTNGVNCSRNTVSKSNGAKRSQNPQAALEA